MTVKEYNVGPGERVAMYDGAELARGFMPSIRALAEGSIYKDFWWDGFLAALAGMVSASVGNERAAQLLTEAAERARRSGPVAGALQ